MSYESQFPGSALAETDPVIAPDPPKAPTSGEDLCSSCLSSATCSVALAKVMIALASGNQIEPATVLVGSCPFYVLPARPEDGTEEDVSPAKVDRASVDK
jgi:hypothetical protein